MVEVVEVSPSFDFEMVAAFQREAFGRNPINPERWRLQVAAYYRWKYLPPAGPARLAMVKSGAKMLAMIVAVPFDASLDSKRLRVWQICDIATHSKHRGRGLAAACLNALQAMAGDEILYCFPNARSRRSLTRAGLALEQGLNFRVRPVLPRKAAAIHPARAWSDCLAAATPELHVLRSSEFLQWRYGSHPLIEYACIASSNDTSAGNFLVLRRVVLAGLPVALVLESVPPAAGGHADVAVDWARANRCFATVWARRSESTTPHLDRSIGLIFPRIVAVYSASPALTLSQSDWQFQLGDWDAV